MASNTMATWHKRVRSHVNMGKKRKNAQARHSTLSSAELFGALGEPGRPAPAAGSVAAPKKYTTAPTLRKKAPAAKAAPASPASK